MELKLHRSALEDLGAVRITGPDAVAFLQGQVSNDVTRLGPEHALLAGYHNPQGRTLALLRLVALGEGDVLALLPNELAAPVSARLAKYVLRAKVRVTDASAAWQIFALANGSDLPQGEPTDVAPEALSPPQVGAVRRLDGRRFLTIDTRPLRRLEIAAREGASAPADPAAREHWRLLDVRAALPQVYRATSELFVAQMLNLDALEAIDFDKGCYTGQEVIARAHYRGRVKRRAQRFRSREALKLAPADTGVLPDGRAFTVVDAAALPDGRCEFLAVAPLAAGSESTGAPSLEADALEMPYALPA